MAAVSLYGTDSEIIDVAGADSYIAAEPVKTDAALSRHLLHLRAIMSPFKHLLEPRTIAVVGVSDDAARPGSQAVRALLANGFRGGLYPVNPKYPSFEGLPCYASLEAIEGGIDLVVIGVPAAGVLAVLRSCAAKKVGYALILSGGFRESGPEGVEREREALAIAREGGFRLVGPNCLGLVNVHAGVYAAFGSMTRPPKLEPGGVSVVTQSGGFGYSIVLACAEAGIGFRHVVATGNETDIDSIQLIEALIDDPDTRCIVVYIEGMSDGRALLRAGRRALAAGKPILLWKAGITEQGARAAASHTASMTGSYDFYTALFKQSGIVEIKEMHEAVDFLLAFESGKYPAGPGVAIMGVSGGSAIVFADAGEPEGLELCELSPSTQAALAEVVPHIGAVHNPIDLTAGYFSPGNRERLQRALRATLADPRVDALCVNLATTGAAGSLAAAEVVGRIAREVAKPIVVFSSSPATQVGEALERFRADGIPVFRSPSRAARALAVLERYRRLRERCSAVVEPADLPLPTAMLERLGGLAPGECLSERESKSLLEAAGIPVTRDQFVKVGDQADFASLQAPLVVKVASPDIAHKTEAGGVVLGVRSQHELGEAIERVQVNARRYAPQARIEGVLVSEMVRGGFELIAGVVNDVVFGPVVVVGAGGIHAEVLKDSSCRLAPFDEATAHEMLDELRCRPILDGVRGAPALDVASVARLLAVLSSFAWAQRTTIGEIDINPLFVLSDRAVAADALVIAASWRD